LFTTGLIIATFAILALAIARFRINTVAILAFAGRGWHSCGGGDTLAKFSTFAVSTLRFHFSGAA